METLLLSNLYELAYRAYAGTSFHPEKRAEAIVVDFSAELAEDLATLENPGNYQSKYEKYITAWLVAKSRCLSFMITGAANFPVARNEKNNNRERSAYDKFRAWREGYFKAVNRVRTLSPEEELDKTLAELDNALAFQEACKGSNKIMRAKKGTIEEKLAQVLDLYGQRYVDLLKENNACYVSRGQDFWGFEGFALTNHNAKIKRLTEKVNVMKIRIARKGTFEKISFDGGYIDIEADRVIIKHDSKPERSVIDALKSRGFRWSREHACWCRKHTGQAIADAKKIVGI